MSYWLVKTEPEVYAWDRLVQDGETSWDGVRNFQARNNLQAMQEGDRVLIYHSGDEKEIRGVAEVVKTAYPDPSATEGNWVSVRLKAVKPVSRSIGLEEIRNTHGLAVLPLVLQPRLSVMPITDEQWAALMKYTKTEL